MKDAWRAAPKLDAPDADEADGLAPLPHWSMNCPGGRIVVRSRDAVDEFGGLSAVATLLSGADNAHVAVALPGSAEPLTHGRTLRFSAKRGDLTVAVYAVNLGAGTAGELKLRALSQLLNWVRTCVERAPQDARRLGVSVVLR